jgi:2-polyprenyl-3-methyl-5-hydroxy-6-metoxy-1,4-benzoquinol methylase
MNSADGRLKEIAAQSNQAAQTTWNEQPVGSQRSKSPVGTPEFFREVRAYRYGYETPWIPDVFRFAELRDKRVLEIGVGLGIDASEMIRSGAIYTGLDVTRRHIELAGMNIEQQFGREAIGSRATFVEGDLLETRLPGAYDRMYSFGVLHHIEHEAQYLARMRELLVPGGQISIAVYSSVSVFNAYLVATWLLRNKGKNTLHEWTSHVTEGSPLDKPVTIKIRTRKPLERMIRDAGFRITSYDKRGFVQNYIPLLGKRLAPNGPVLRACGRILGWYHCFFAEAR